MRPAFSRVRSAAAFAALLAALLAAPAVVARLGVLDRATVYATMPVGNGPFKASQYVDGQYMEMVANEDFYAGRPYLDKFVVRFGDADTLTAALEAQEIDGSGVSAGPVYDRLTGLDYLVGNPVPRTHPDGFVVNVERFDKRIQKKLQN